MHYAQCPLRVYVREMFHKNNQTVGEQTQNNVTSYRHNRHTDREYHNKGNLDLYWPTDACVGVKLVISHFISKIVTVCSNVHANVRYSRQMDAYAHA